MKTVKFSDVATVSVRDVQSGDVAVNRNGKKFFVVSKDDAEKFSQKPSGIYVFIRPVKVSVNELMSLLPGILAVIPYRGRNISLFSVDSLKNILLPDLSAEKEFKDTLLGIKSKIDEAGALLAEAQQNYDTAYKDFVSYVKANLVTANKE